MIISIGTLTEQQHFSSLFCFLTLAITLSFEFLVEITLVYHIQDISNKNLVTVTGIVVTFPWPFTVYITATRVIPPLYFVWHKSSFSLPLMSRTLLVAPRTAWHHNFP